MRRPERLAEALKEEISEVVGFELDDPNLQNATVTDVEVAPDMRRFLSGNTIVVSLLAGVEAASVRQRFPGVGAIVRAISVLMRHFT